MLVIVLGWGVPVVDVTAGFAAEDGDRSGAGGDDGLAPVGPGEPPDRVHAMERGAVLAVDGDPPLVDRQAEVSGEPWRAPAAGEDQVVGHEGRRRGERGGQV